MSMTRPKEKSPPCSTPTPTNNDSDDADPDIHITKQPMFPRFLVVESTDPQKKLPGLNDVILDRTIQGVTSVSAGIEWMGSALLVEVSHEAYARNLQKLTQIGEVPVKVAPHRSLNTRKGVAKFGRAAIGMSNEEVKDAINSSPRNRGIPFVAEAYRVSVNRNKLRQPTGTFFLTFQATTLPPKIRLGFEQFDVDLYVPSPRRCFKCQKFGHHSRTCRANEDVCPTCSAPGHSKEACPNSDTPKCLNCKGSQSVSSRECPRFVVEKAALQIQAESHCSIAEAREQAEQASTRANDSYAAAASSQLSNQSRTLQPKDGNQSEIVQVLKAQNESLQDQINTLSSRITELLGLLKALTESTQDTRDTQSQNRQSAEPQPDMPQDNQPAVHQPALPRDKQAGL